MRKHLLSASLIILLTGFVWAQAPKLQAVTEQEETGITAETQPEAGIAKINKPGTITFSFKDADIRNVMRLIAAKAGINIVYGSEVTGVVNMELRDVPWEQALHLVLDLNGYASQKEGNVIKVLTKDEVAKEPLSTEVFTLNYATAADVEESIKQMLSGRGSIKTDARSNTVIVTDVPANINKIETVLAKLDGRTTQVLIETKIVEVRNTLEKDLGIKWTSLKDYKLSLGNASRTYRSIRRGGHGIWDSGTENVDTEGKTDVYSDIDKDITDQDKYYVSGVSTKDTVNYDLTNTITRTITETLSNTLLKGDIRTAILSAADFELVLSALQEDTDTKLLSNPRIVTADNEAAEIKVISEYPVPNYEFDTETSQWSITGFDKEEIGVTFDVTPNISADGYITMRIEPEVSTLIDLVPFTAGGATVYIPYVGRKKASSKLVIKSGDTLAVGGLIDEDKVNTITKVPVLGDIPILGRLFRHEDVDNIEKNIIFFITATIIDEGTKSLVSEMEPVAYEKAAVDYNKVFGQKESNLDKGLSSGNRGYITSNQ